jgi:formylmethanofuran dehydrogenase subunit E
MRNLQTLLAQSAEQHHCLCPRQVLGVRMGLLAGELLELDLPNPEKRLFTFVETDGCGLDGISVATGCTVGRRNMRVLDIGKMAATFVDTVTREALRIVPLGSARTYAERYAPDGVDRWQAQLLAYQIMPVEELFAVQPVVLTVSLKDIISRHGLRVRCERCGEEIMNGREVKDGSMLICRSCAGQAYYSVQADSVAQESCTHEERFEDLQRTISSLAL